MESFSVIVTATVVIYGAVLSTYTAWKNIRGKRRALKVDVRYAFPHAAPESLVTITLSNPGYYRVTAQSVAFKLPDKRLLVFPHESLPHSLRPGTGLTLYHDANTLALQLAEKGFSGIVRLVGTCSDDIGGEHRSKPFNFDHTLAQKGRR